jgi:hypothetical protein
MSWRRGYRVEKRSRRMRPPIFGAHDTRWYQYTNLHDVMYQETGLLNMYLFCCSRWYVQSPLFVKGYDTGTEDCNCKGREVLELIEYIWWTPCGLCVVKTCSALTCAVPFSRYTFWCLYNKQHITLLQTKRNLLYIRNQSVPRCKHFPPRL